jgi:hypothetical protein
MGAWCTVSVHCLGFGAMATIKNNEHPQYLVQRGRVYYYNGKDLNMFFDFK